MQIILLIQAAATWALVGLIWVIQLVHYPLMVRVGDAQFVAYELAHQRAITPLVGVLMLAELLSALAWVQLRPNWIPTWQAVTGLALLCIIWLSTALWQMPLHAKLGAGLDAELLGQLVQSNWIRTAAWTLRGGLVAWWVWQAMQAPNSSF